MLCLGGIYTGTERVITRISVMTALVLWLVFVINTVSSDTLVSVEVAASPAIDGVPEAIWDSATAITINTAGGANTGSKAVALSHAVRGKI